MKFRGPPVRVLLNNITLQVGYGEAERGSLDSHGQSFRAKAGSVSGRVRSDINTLLAYLRRNRPGCILGELTIRGEANAQDIFAKGDNLNKHAGVAEFDSIQKNFAGIRFLGFTGNLPGMGLLLG